MFDGQTFENKSSLKQGIAFQKYSQQHKTSIFKMNFEYQFITKKNKYLKIVFNFYLRIIYILNKAMMNKENEII